jgi:serine/threonine protein kinase
MFHNKRLSVNHAIIEIDNITFADIVDPDNKYHIGHPKISASDLTIINTSKHTTYVTLSYPYGGTSLDNIDYNTVDCLELVANIEDLFVGLVAFHQNKLYHLDIKTSNIVRDTEGKLRIIDFGISHIDPQECNGMFNAIYTVWPFESILLGDTNDDIFSDSYYGEYIDNPYYKTIYRFLGKDTYGIRENIMKIQHNKLCTIEQLCDLIYPKIDVYSTGMLIATLLSVNSLRLAIIGKDLHLYEELYRFCHTLLDYNTMTRPTMSEALALYRQIITQYKLKVKA